MTRPLTEQDLQRWVLPLLQLCRQAGEVINGYYNAADGHAYQTKADDSPLTRADLASHAVLLAGLAALDPHIPLLSEESAPADIANRQQWQRYWLVDPLDGTREFLERTGEFTINIALICNHRPVLGMLYRPLARSACVGIPGVLARRYLDDGVGNWLIGELATRALQTGEPLAVLASRRHRGSELESCLAWLDTHWGPVSRQSIGSALKFCMLAQGEGDFYPRFSPCCEWDTAAGQAVLEAAGGCVLGLDGEPLRYNCSASLRSPSFYAIADGRHPLWRQLLAAR